MGKPKTNNVQNFVTSLSSSVFKTMVSIKNDCKQAGAVVQNLSIEIGNPENVQACIDTKSALLQHLQQNVSAADMLKLLESQKGIVEECQGFMTQNTIMRDIENAADMDITADCKFEQTDINKMNAKLTSELMSKAGKKEDDFGETLKNVSSVFGGGKGRVTNNILNETNVGAFVENTFTVDSVNEMVADYNLIQSLNLKVSAAKDTYVAATKQVARVHAVTNCLTKNAAVADALAHMQTTSTADASMEGKGLVDLGDSLFSNVNDLGSNLGKGAFGAMSAVAIAWIAAVVAVVVIVIIVIFLVVRSRKSSPATNNYKSQVNVPTNAGATPSYNTPPPAESIPARSWISSARNEAVTALRDPETRALLENAARRAARSFRR